MASVIGIFGFGVQSGSSESPLFKFV